MKIKNRLNSPYELINADGEKVMLPARGEIEFEPHPMHVGYYRQVGYFEITDSAPNKSEPAKEVDPRDALREQYKELSGENADKRWSESRLRSEIDALLES